MNIYESAQACAYGKLLNKIVQTCDCFPSYVADGRSLVLNSKSIPNCSFYQHAACVSFVKVRN